MDKGHKPKRLYQVWKGSNVSVSLSSCVNFVFLKDLEVWVFLGQQFDFADHGGLLSWLNLTTYENFRYRYDKKENPYNRGVIRNIREIFFSKILPSMNKFRSFVDEDEHMAVGSLTPNLGDNMDRSKERIDIEMGAKVAGASNLQCPNASDELGEFAKSSRESGQKSIAEDGAGESVQSSIADNAVIESSQNFTPEDGVFINNSIVEDRTNPAEGRTDDHNSHQTTALVLQV
ncbi:hypothetical protein DKX38_008944 [Salix brachista]|uniref:Uncharacterized protein n=1 Tax=Salix brachista TaxID=2182728 RepID=A0A5N5MBI6_9ROSI|nr:hypothetical protein DKX38_008944 [Salix brachista]